MCQHRSSPDWFRKKIIMFSSLRKVEKTQNLNIIHSRQVTYQIKALGVNVSKTYLKGHARSPETIRGVQNSNFFNLII